MQERLGLTSGDAMATAEIVTAAVEGRCCTEENSTLVAAELVALVDSWTGEVSADLWRAVWRQVGVLC